MKKIAFFAAIMVVGAGVALATTLNVPFFADTSTDNASKIAGRIGVKESAGVNQTLTVIYTAINASGNPAFDTVTFALPADSSVRWNPAQSNPAETAAANAVGNMNINGQAFGGAAVISSVAGGISGYYSEINFTRQSDSAYVLLPQ